MATFKELATKVANGNDEALVFLGLWANYAHGIDDIVDEDIKGAEAIMHVFMLGHLVYNCPFFVRNRACLDAVMVHTYGLYTDSERLKKEGKTWATAYADIIRCCGNDVVRAVAYIVGGFEHMQAISLCLAEESYKEHHNEKNEPI